MILADKIIENRKKNGWSQEGLADRLGVSRQSVSKWEGAQAIPDMKKIVQLAELFGVTTDYLLKDEIEEETVQEAVSYENDVNEEKVRKVSLEEANEFLTHNDKAASWISTGVMLCILSPVLLIALGGAAEAGRLSISESAAIASGIGILLIMVACAVAIFITMGLKGSRFDYLETLDVDTEYGVTGMVKERKSEFSTRYAGMLVGGIVLCVISSVPLVMYEILNFHHGDGMFDGIAIGGMLVIIAIGVKMIVHASIRQEGYNKILEEGDYTRVNKRAGRFDGIYWAVITAIYLGWSFYNMRWELTWIIWPVAGVIFAIYREIMKAVVRSHR